MVSVEIKNDDEDKSVKSEQRLIVNSTNEDQSFDCDANKQEEDVPLVFSMK